MIKGQYNLTLLHSCFTCDYITNSHVNEGTGYLSNLPLRIDALGNETHHEIKVVNDYPIYTTASHLTIIILKVAITILSGHLKILKVELETVPIYKLLGRWIVGMVKP